MVCLFVCLFVLPVNQFLQALQALAAQVHLEPTTKMLTCNLIAGESFEKELKTQYCKQYPFRAVKG